MTDTNQDLTADLRERVAALGYEVVDVRRSGSRRVHLKVRVDRADALPGQGITIADCAAVSRALERWLDDEGPLGPDYVLEVSSPGLERPVRWPEHWERFVGRDVLVRLPGRGRLRATIVEVRRADETVTLRPADQSEPWTGPIAEAREARLAVDWTSHG